MSASSLFLRLLPDGPGSARAGSPQAGPARPPPWSGYSAALDPFAGRTARPATLEDDPFLGRPQRGTSSQAFRGCGCLVKPRQSVCSREIASSARPTKSAQSDSLVSATSSEATEASSWAVTPYAVAKFWCCLA